MAPVRVRSLKKEKGTSGASERSSARTKPPSRTTERASRPIGLQGAPAGAVGVDQRVDQHRQGRRDRDRACEVEGPGRRFCPALGDQRGRQRGSSDADRDVDPEHPLPADRVGEDASQQDAGGSAGAGDRAPDSQGLVALGAVAEGGGDDRQCRGREDRRAQALNRAGHDQLALGLGQAPGQRGEREEDQAADEDAAPAEQVSHPPAEQQEAAEGEDVGVDHPLQVALGEVERLADRRQGDVDDRGVEDDHELGHREQRQGDPAPLLRNSRLGHLGLLSVGLGKSFTIGIENSG